MAREFQITASLFLFTSVLVGGSWIWYIIVRSSPLDFIVLTAVAVFLSFILGILCLIISTQHYPKHYSIVASLRHFIVKHHRLFVGRRFLRRFRACCENPRKVQEELLLNIIERNRNTVYGRQFEIGNINSLDDLRIKHPVTDYNRYETFVNRIAKGEKNVTTTERVTRLALTSGTTGKGKIFPQDRYFAERIGMIGEAFQQEMFPDLQPMQSKLRIHCNVEGVKSESGLTMTSVTAVEDLMLKHMVTYSTPSEGFMIGHAQSAIYVHLLFALRDRYLGSIQTSFVSLFSDSIQYLEANWKKLVEDLANGTLNPAVKVKSDIRASLTKALGSGDIHRALEVQRECEKGFDGILKRLWPHLQFVTTIDNVGLRNILKQSIAKGVEIYTSIYVCTEGLMGLNLWPFEEGDQEYVLNLAEIVFEFIPEDDIDKPKPRSLFVDEVQIGQTYELLITQKFGLYRYSFGDVIKVSGFYKNCPKVIFLYRKATLLNLIGEKVSQPVIQDSLKAALYPWVGSVELSHYSVAESVLLLDFFNKKEGTGKIDLFYIFFLELKPSNDGSFPEDLNPKTLAEEIDRNILEHHDESFRQAVKTHISQSKVYFVKVGAFHKLREFILTNTSATLAQFKMPLKLRTAKMAEILLENIQQR